MIRATESVLSEKPFIVRREVRWGDCDPAGVVHTGRFPAFLLGAVSLFSDHMAGNNGKRLGDVHGVGTPCKAMSFEFVGTLWPNDVIDIQCTVGQVRTKSYDIHVIARRPDGSLVFKSVFSPICVRQDARVGTEIPDSLRAVLMQHTAPVPTGAVDA